MRQSNSVFKVFRDLFFGLALMVLSMSLIACGELRKIDEMKDATSEMNQTTKTLLDKTGEMKDGMDKMSKSTDEMNDSTKDLRTLTREELIQRLEDVNGNTSALFDAMRQGDTSNLRRLSFNEILKEPTLQGRVAEAGLYLMSFEFQVLGNVGKDKQPAHRELLYQQALLEFFLKLDRIAPAGGEIWPDAKPTDEVEDEENRASAFNAIAFTLHKTNRQQLPDPAYGKPMSLYDLIIVALKLKPEIDSGRIVLPAGPHFIKEVLARPDRVRQLLQTRYNMFTYGLLGLTTNMVEYGTTRQLWNLLWKLKIDVSEATRGPAVLQYLHDEIMQPGAATAEDMLSVGIQPQLTKTTALAVSRVDIKFHSKDFSVRTQQTAPREDILEELWRRYSKPKLSYPVGSR